MKKYLFILAILVFSTFLFSQDPEVLFNQAENRLHAQQALIANLTK